MAMLTSPSNLEGGLMGLAIMMVECLPIGGAFQSGSFARDCGMSISR